MMATYHEGANGQTPVDLDALKLEDDSEGTIAGPQDVLDDLASLVLSPWQEPTRY
jgi:hypothetical protein